MRKFLLQVTRTDKPATKTLFESIFKHAKGVGMSYDYCKEIFKKPINRL